MNRSKHNSGQVILLLVFIITGMIFLLSMNMDIFLAIRDKVRIQNAGDSAALSGARWQGITLNLIGDLNIARLSVLCANAEEADSELDETLDGITAMQERIAFTGPIVGFEKANEAAIRNGVPVNTPMAIKMTELVKASIRSAPEMLEDTPTWENKGTDYANMLIAACAKGVCASVDNARYFTCNASGQHMLYNRGFYDAVNSRDWCWFCSYFQGHEKAIAWLRGFSGWGDIPEPDQLGSVINSEFFGVSVWPASINNFTNDVNRDAVRIIVEAAIEHGANASIVNEENILKGNVLARPNDVWYFYNYEMGWRPWNKLDRSCCATAFPIVGNVKPEYYVSGAMASCRVTGRLTPFSSRKDPDEFYWTAAAKPFGSVSCVLGLRKVTDLFVPDWAGSFPQNAPLVFPSFKFARLIPLGGADAHDQGDPDWVTHVREHVWGGSPQFGSCKFCIILQICEQVFPSGADWLIDNPHDEVCEGCCCNSCMPKGGTPYAH